MSKATGTLEEARVKAELLDSDVIGGDETTLLIDFDGQGQLQFGDYHDLIDDIFGIVSEERWPSASGVDGHEHLKLTLSKKLTVSQRIALQAALGSDPKREILAVGRQIDGDMGEVSLLFKPRQKSSLLLTA